jgi:hypothetical protein
MSIVALGLRLGAGSSVRAAVVYGAPLSEAGTGLAWQIVAYDEDRGYREPVSLPEVDVIARARGTEVRWRGSTNADGAAEMLLRLPASPEALEVRAGGALLARGTPMIASPPRDPPSTGWARFSRREGDVLLDVAVLGQRVATGFPADLLVRATDAVTHRPLADLTIEAERDASFLPAVATTTTDRRGWAHVVATPVGHAVAVVLHARAEGHTGVWAGGLAVSPGAAQVAVDARVSPDDEPSIDVVVPTLRSTAYVEIDDARGRAWATAVPLTAARDGLPHVTVRAPKLAPGLYWAVESGDPAGGAILGPGTLARPFFVAPSDEAALAFGTDRSVCAPPMDGRETARAIATCLAVAAPAPVPRWIALEGFSMQHARDAERRARGLALAVGGILVAGALEVLLLLRTAAIARARLRDTENAVSRHLVGRAWTIGVALLVAMLGFVLLGAFLVRLG